MNSRNVRLLVALCSAIGCGDAADGKPPEAVPAAPEARIHPLLPEMVPIPAGEFAMGSDELGSAEQPVHRVYLDAYSIGKFEVTNSQYKRFCDETGYPVPGAQWFPDAPETTARELALKPNHPVVGISWADAVAYAEWLSRETGHGYRLPTEAEWEKAARGGVEGTAYPWGDEAYDAGGVYRANLGWDSDNDRVRELDGFLYSAPVGKFPANGYGLYDMAGNVWEWCADFYDAGYYSQSEERNPRGPATGETPVLRGGSWFGGPRYLRNAARLWNYPKIRYASTGFRVAMTPK